MIPEVEVINDVGTMVALASILVVMAGQTTRSCGDHSGQSCNQCDEKALVLPGVGRS